MEVPFWQKVLAGAVAVALIFWASYTYLFKPKLKEIDAQVKTLKMIDDEINIIMPKELVLKKGISESELIKAELATLMKKIPTESEVPYIIDELISDVGKGLNIDYNLIEPQGLVTEGNYKRLPLKIDFDSDYIDLNLYIEELKTLPTTVRIDNLDLSRTGEPPKLRVHMVLSTFVMPGGPVIERKGTVEVKPYLYDPFFKAPEKKVTKLEKREELSLQGIWKGKVLKAIINDEAVGIGESVSGYKVLKIEDSRVVLVKAGKISILKWR